MIEEKYSYNLLLQFQKLVVIDIFVNRFAEKARLIKNQQNMKNGY